MSEDLKFYEQPSFINLILIMFNLTLFLFKLYFSVITNSLALQADAYDNLTDLILCLIAAIGIFFVKKKPNKKFPYGYYKLENLISLFISLIIFYTAYTIINQSFTKILSVNQGETRSITVSPEIYLFLIISLLCSIILVIYLNIVGKKTNSVIIQSEASEKRYDVLISLSVIISFLAASVKLFVLDPIISIFIALFIIKGGYNIFIASIKPLLDAVIDYDNRAEIYKLIEQNPKVKSVENLEIRSYGRYIFLEIDILIIRNLPLHKIDSFKDDLKNEIMTKFQNIFKILIIINHPEKSITKLAVPVEESNELNSIISNDFGESKFFAFVEIEEDKVINVEILFNKFAEEPKRKGLLISEWLISKKIDELYVKKELHKGPLLILENSLIPIILTDKETLQQLVSDELNNS